MKKVGDIVVYYHGDDVMVTPDEYVGKIINFIDEYDFVTDLGHTVGVDFSSLATVDLIKKYRPDLLVKINNHINNKPADLYSPKGNFIGTVETELSFNDVRIQIKRQSLEGYYFMFEGTKIDIDSNGGIDIWPDGFFDVQQNQLKELLGF